MLEGQTHVSRSNIQSLATYPVNLRHRCIISCVVYISVTLDHSVRLQKHTHVYLPPQQSDNNNFMGGANTLCLSSQEVFVG